MKENRLGNFLALVVIVMMTYGLYARYGGVTLGVIAVSFAGIASVVPLLVVAAGGNSIRKANPEPNPQRTYRKEQSPLSA